MNDVKVDMPLSNWFALCVNNIYMYSKEQMKNCGIPIDLQSVVINGVLLKIQQEHIDNLINENAELILNNSGGNNKNDTG